MKKLIINICIVFAFCMILLPSKNVYCTTNNTIISPSLQGELIKLKDNQLTNLASYQEKYGSAIFGMVAYFLNIVRIYSIPFCFLGIAFGAVKQYVLGIRKLDTLEQGMYIILSSVTVLIIAQILPLLFAIFVKFNKG